jgi:hypothetical protein
MFNPPRARLSSTDRTVAAGLADPASYAPSIARTEHALRHADPASAALLRRHGGELARRLADEVGRGAYVPAPAARRVVRFDKPRSVVQLTPVERVVHGTVARLVSAAFEPRYADGLCSYRPGRGPSAVLERLATAAAAHRAAVVEPRARGLWVLRGDVASFGDSVPIDEASPLWTTVRAWLPDEPAWVPALVQALGRCGRDDTFDAHGLPTGSAICIPLINAHLDTLDRAMGATARAYARYGDDLVVAFDEPAAAERGLAQVHALVADRGVALSPAKQQQLYWTAVGRPAARPGWRGTPWITVVGFDVGFDGRRRLKRARRRELVAAARTRLRAAAALLPPSPVEARIGPLAAAAAALLDPRSPLALPGLAPALAAIDCREQLAELDRELALELAGVIAGVRGPRALRVVRWRALHDAGLPSLTAARNRGLRPARGAP